MPSSPLQMLQCLLPSHQVSAGASCLPPPVPPSHKMPPVPLHAHTEGRVPVSPAPSVSCPPPSTLHVPSQATPSVPYIPHPQTPFPPHTLSITSPLRHQLLPYPQISPLRASEVSSIPNQRLRATAYPVRPPGVPTSPHPRLAPMLPRFLPRPDSSPMAPLADLYHLTMAYALWRTGRHRDPAAAELFFRREPFGAAFAVGAGLGQALRSLGALRFSAADIAYLRSVLPSTTEDAFFDYLSTVDASEVTVTSVPEGSVVFSRVPLLQVKGPLLVVQLLETTLLCLVSYASLVATNAARFRLLAGPEMKLMELGLRRAQGPDGGLSASKYSYIGGFDYTSNVLAGKLYGIPVRGTVAHSYIMSFRSMEEVQPRVLSPLAGGEPMDLPSLAESWLQRVCELLGTPSDKPNRGELAAFVSYAIAFPQDFQGLLDTYCVMRSGLPNFCAVALALHQLGYRAIGVRLDSGDLIQQSKETRRVLRACSAQ
ncbi:nicotinate phosphoribosyltransferase isoform X2 [Phasianus colchicus]|uniref:nicotinate phosphoribosyltransferase isoform X2 n=1 Tax=Phasianus colchicus TaxID=9054 RepID=UPI00129D4E83|nr:nicotinate phosphoribosyltransferase isoform X2 [Phasianus colchicus]